MPMLDGFVSARTAATGRGPIRAHRRETGGARWSVQGAATGGPKDAREDTVPADPLDLTEEDIDFLRMQYVTNQRAIEDLAGFARAVIAAALAKRAKAGWDEWVHEDGTPCHCAPGEPRPLRRSRKVRVAPVSND